MGSTKWRPLNAKHVDIVFFATVVFVFLLRILLLFSPAREQSIQITYLAPLVAAMIVYLLMRFGFPRTPAIYLPPLFAVWFLICRILNGDSYLSESHVTVYSVLLSCCVLFLAPFAADKEQRGKLLNAVALVYSISFSIIAWVAVLAALSNSPWVNPIDNSSILGINQVYADPYRLNILDIHPNISSIFFYTSLSLLIYLFTFTKRIWARILYGLLGTGLYLAICMTGSISAIVVTGLIIGIVLFSWILKAEKIGKWRIMIAVLAMVGSVAAVVATYPMVIQWTTDLYENVQQETTGSQILFSSASAEEAEQKETELTAEASDIGDEEKIVFVEDRLQVSNMTTNMKARFLIYSSAFLSIEDRPITLLIGELWDDAMARSAKVINFLYQNHLHNAFLQTLVVGGGISLLMILVFSVLLAIYGIRLFFNKRAPFHLKMLILAPVGMLCHSMTEAFLFIDTRLPNMLFFFLSAMIIAYASELVPGKGKQAAEIK